MESSDDVLSFAYFNGNKIVVMPEDILQENHYYPFGMDLSGPWMNDAAPDNRYKYNGKEYNDDFGLNWMDYGARWYDGAVGRWWSGDPLAEKFPNWSPYNYVVNNPIIFIDPDGMDIVLGLTQRPGETSEDFDARRYAYFDKVQSLTNDVLRLEGDKIVIAKTKEGSKSAGTQLIRNLIDGVQTEDGTIKNFTVTIVDADINGTNPVDENDNRTTASEIKSKDGSGTGTIVRFNIKGRGEKVVNSDNTTGYPLSLNQISLGHELIHAEHNMRGENKNHLPTTSLDPDDMEGSRTLSREELYTRRKENIIRREQRAKLRQINPGQ